MNRVKGFTPCSTVDWPGKIVSVIYIGGCNFRCGYCHNPELALNTAEPYPVDDIFRSIKKNREWLDGIVITGGEPTFFIDTHFMADLMSFLIPIRIDTNGSYPAGLLWWINQGCSAVMMDVKTTPDKYKAFTGWEFPEFTVGLLNDAKGHLDVQFRTTAIPGLVEESEIREIRKLVKKPHTVQFFRPGRCLDPKFNDLAPFTPEREAAMRKKFKNELGIQGGEM